MSHLSSDPERLRGRLRRITGQLGAVERALGEDQPCAAVLQQLAAARGALNGLMEEIIEAHLMEHVARPDLAPDARAAGAEELLAVDPNCAPKASSSRWVSKGTPASRSRGRAAINP